MLSTEPVKDIEKARDYFLGEDNYYTEGGSLAQERSLWWGKGAAALGLSGTVDPEQFLDLLRGHLPSGQQLGKKEEGEIIHRPGVDLTFSVPKSVSLLGLLGEDQRIFKAIETATDRVLEVIEHEQAKTRVRKDGVLKVERTGNLVVARFLHDISREGDPQLHTHCVVMNATLRKDGKWRSLASKLGHYAQDTPNTLDGFLEDVRHHQKYYGALFRAELAYGMHQLGYTVEKSGAHGFFEIAGISKESIALYSQRRQEIEEYLESHGLSGGKAAEIANLKTRRAKQAIDQRTLKMVWETRAALQGILAFEEARQVVAQSQQQAQVLSSPESIQVLSVETLEKAQFAMKEAIAHLSETQVALKETDLLARAIYYSIGDVPISALIPALQAVLQSGELIPITSEEKNEKSERHFTTPALLNYEKALLQAIHQPHPSGQPLIEASLLKVFLQQHGDLTREQRQAIETLFSSDRQLMALTGPTGSGKTHLIEPMMTLAKIGGYQPILLTSKKAETVALQKQIQKAPANLREWLQRLFDNQQFDTVFNYLRKNQEVPSRLESWVRQHLHAPKKPLIFVDNATQLSSRQVCELRSHVQRNHGYVMLIGDPQSTLTWRVGTPLTQLLAQGMLAAELTRQPLKSSNPLKTAITHSLQKNIVAAFEQIGQRLISIEDREQRHTVMAAQVAGLSPKERARTIVLAPTQAVAHELNVAIRDALKIRGEIDQNHEISLKVLLPHYLRLAEQHTARHYITGQWIRFHQEDRALRVRRGDYCRIEKIDPKNNELLLKNSRDKKDKIHRWNPAQSPEGSIEVFDEKTRAIAAGDTLLCHRSNKAHGLVKGDRVMVTAVTEHRLTLRHESGKTLPSWKLSEMSSRHWDYGMALTALQSSHRHPDIVIAYQNSQSRQSHQRAFYHLLAQAGQQAWIYTENSTQLLKTLEKHTGDKLTAVEALLHHDTPDPLRTSTTTADCLRLLEAAVQKALQQLTPLSSAPPLSQADATAIAAQEAVHYALAYLSEKEAAFDHKAVMTVALTHRLGQVNEKALKQTVLEAEKQGELIRGVYSIEGTRWTTREALTLEREIIRLAQQDRGTLPPRISQEVVNAYLDKTPTSPEHARVLRELAVQTDRVVLLQGFAGTGKTTLLQHIEQLQHIHGALQEGQQALLCLAPTHVAVKEIRGRGLAGHTLDRFLLNVAAGKLTPEAYRGRCIVVDESSMVSNQRVCDFIKALIHLDATGMLVGDVHQYTSVDSGKPFEILQRVGLSTVHLTEITRQQHNKTLQAAVHAVYQKDFSQVFKVLENRIIEIGGYIDNKNKHRDNRAERMALIAEDYVSRDAMRRAQTQIITFGNEDRVMQNALVREGLILQGELTGPRLVTDILVSRRLGEIERSQVGFYHVGDILRFNISQSGGIHKGEYWRVVGITPEGQRLQLERPDSDPVLWKPQPYKSGGRAGVEVYEIERRELMVGDLIRWTRTDEALGLLSPEMAQVEAVILPSNPPETTIPVAAGEIPKPPLPKPDPAKIIVRSLEFTDQGLVPTGNPIELISTSPRLQHWDHVYTITGYSAQGKNIRETLINAESHRPQLTNQRSLLVVLTRATHQVTLYTDNKERLLQAVKNNPGRKSSALEAVGEIPPLSSSRPSSGLKPEISQDRRGYDQSVSKAFYPDEQAAPGMESMDNPDAWRLTISPPEVHPENPKHPDNKLTAKSEPIPAKPTPSPRLDAQRISQCLTDQAELVVEQLLGEPKTKVGGQYRYGTKQGIE
jgi:conjugative transfer relaxase protein TraI